MYACRKIDISAVLNSQAELSHRNCERQQQRQLQIVCQSRSWSRSSLQQQQTVFSQIRELVREWRLYTVHRHVYIVRVITTADATSASNSSSPGSAKI
ncbi:hypothetical protein TYRP_005040 [Tyrophagus putrescentiae]|nr:hypothetical protein TYRP_005040 [Tyrophagus putrescentiae]